MPPAVSRFKCKTDGLSVPDRPIIPFIEGDGTGPGYLAGEPAGVRRGGREGLRRQAADRVEGSARRAEVVRQDRATGCRTKRSTPSASSCVGIKGPLTTPVGGGIRSLNVALRQILDLYRLPAAGAVLRGVPTPVKQPELVDMVIFRENTEDIYAGIEYAGGTPESQKVLDFLAQGVPEGGRQGSLRHARRKSTSWQQAARIDRRAAARAARSRSASASSRSATSAPSGSCTARSATRSRTSGRA